MEWGIGGVKDLNRPAVGPLIGDRNSVSSYGEGLDLSPVIPFRDQGSIIER